MDKNEIGSLLELVRWNSERFPTGDRCKLYHAIMGAVTRRALPCAAHGYYIRNMFV